MQQNSNREWKGKSRGGSFGYRFFILLIRRCGLTAAYTFLAFVASYFIPFAPKATAAIWSYNRRILGYGFFKSIAKLYMHYYRFGQTIIDKIAIANGMADRFKFTFDKDYEKFVACLDKGATALIGAHVGCWEVGAQFFSDYASRIHVVMYDAEYQKIKDAIGGEINYKIIAVNQGDIESLVRMKSATNEGGCLCFQGDRYMNTESAELVDFMGAKALFPKGPTLIASKFKIPVVFYFAMREKKRSYKFKFAILDAGLPQEEIQKEYIKALTEVVEEYPQQWFNFYKVWQ